MTRILGYTAIIIAIIAIAQPVQAQVITGSVLGTVADSSGAMVAGAEVRLTNVETGVVRRAQTDSTGNYRFLLLPSSTYTLEASAAGFKNFRREGIVVEVDRSLSVPVVLELGDVSQTVEVTAGTPLLEPNTSSLGAVMETRKIESLPLNGRNPMGLANLLPTVRGIGYFGGQILSTWRMSAVSIGGGHPLSVGYLIDGIANDKMIDSGAMTPMTVDATQEFKVQTNAMSAEFGRTGGGIISVISKSGTNDFHGDVFEYMRNDKLNANEYFSNASNKPRPTLRWNQFGASLGGPIMKDKLFFFGNYEGYRERRQDQKTITSPTDLERAGDFSDTRTKDGTLITIFDPLSTVADPAKPGRYIRTPFPNNKISSDRINPVSSAVMEYYPKPNLPGLPFTRAQNLYLPATRPIDKNTFNIKLDYNLSSSRRLAGRFTRDKLDWGFPNYFGNIADYDGRQILIPRYSTFVQYTDTLSPTFLLDAKVGFNRENEHYSVPAAGFDVTTIGMPAAFEKNRQKRMDGFPRISISDASSFGRPDAQGNPSVTGTASIAATKVEKEHMLKFGYEHRLYRRNDYGVSSPSGNYSFKRGFTQGPDPLKASSTAGYGVASFLLGYPSSASAGWLTDATRSFHYDALFVQDDWKATQKLTLNLGLRWEYEGPVTDRYNALSNFDPSIPSPLEVSGMDLQGGLVYPGVGGLSRGLTKSSYRDFGPRFGFAYQATQKAVVRGGYGIMFIPTTGTGYTATGYTRTTPMVTSIDGGLTPYDTFSNPFPNGVDKPTGSSLGALTGVGSSVSGQLRNVHRGYSQQWNLTVQYEPWSNWLLEAAWVGNHGTRLLMTSRALDIISDTDLARGSELLDKVANPFYGIIASGPLSTPTVTERQLLLPYPQFTSVSGGYAFLGNSIYHALALKVEKRFSRGFSVLMAYTASKLIDDGTNSSQVRPGATVGDTVQNWNNLRAERSKSLEDVPQRMVFTALWQLPFKAGGNAFLRHVVEGWQVNAINTLESGTPVSLSAPISGGGNRPNVVPGVKAKLDNPTLARWFNTDAFSAPPAFTYGNVSRTLPDVHSDGMFNLDLSVFKTFPITERYKLQFRAEAFNLTNTPTFDTPGRSLNAATFGVVTATAFNPKPREMQFALRLDF